VPGAGLELAHHTYLLSSIWGANWGADDAETSNPFLDVVHYGLILHRGIAVDILRVLTYNI